MCNGRPREVTDKKNVRGERQGSYGLVSLVITTLSQSHALSLGGNLLARKTERVAAPLPALQGVQLRIVFGSLDRSGLLLFELFY